MKSNDANPASDNIVHRTPPQAIAWKPDETPAELRHALETLAEDYPIAADTGAGLLVRFERSDDAGCVIERAGRAARVTYTAPAMALRALGTLMAGLVPDGGRYEEQTAFTTFGIMLDCSRNAVMTVAHFKRWLRRLALLGYNMAMLYTEDTYELPGEPFFGYLRGAYSAEELKEIDAYAGRLGIDMIGCIQTLGHLAQILKWSAYADVKDTGSVLLVDEQKTYALIDKMLARCAHVFRSRRVHVGMDETHDLGRGRFMDRYGYERGFDIFNRHLAKVVELCGKHGLRPMIWSDMYFRLGSKTNGYYDKDCVIPPDVIEKIPEDVELVYWDYYHPDVEFYLDWIERHRAMGSEPVMASGVWTWRKFWHDTALTEANAGACVEACRQAGVKEILFTLWGDDGGYCDFDSAFGGLAFAAEKAFTATDDAARLSARFKAVFGADYDTNRAAADLHQVLDPTQVIWDDPLLGIYLHRVRDRLDKAKTHYEKLRARLANATDNGAGNINHARLACAAIARKLALADQLFAAYQAEDRAKLGEVRGMIPDVVAALRALLESLRTMWLARNKPFGIEVLQVRFGGLFERYRELDTRLGEYLDGKIPSIPELDANLPAPPDGGARPTYRNLATGSSIL